MRTRLEVGTNWKSGQFAVPPFTQTAEFTEFSTKTWKISNWVMPSAFICIEKYFYDQGNIGISKAIRVFEFPLLFIWQFECSFHISRGPWIRSFYFFWNTPTVPQLTWKNKRGKNLTEYLKDIPENATLQDMYKTDGKASERFRPYQFCLEREDLTHR